MLLVHKMGGGDDIINFPETLGRLNEIINNAPAWSWHIIIKKTFPSFPEIYTINYYVPQDQLS